MPLTFVDRLCDDFGLDMVHASRFFDRFCAEVSTRCAQGAGKWSRKLK